jgi:hypothetical protein
LAWESVQDKIAPNPAIQLDPESCSVSREVLKDRFFTPGCVSAVRVGFTRFVDDLRDEPVLAAILTFLLHPSDFSVWGPFRHG